MTGNSVVGNKFSSVLPEVYAGHPLRIERYTQYDQMDMDSEVNAALDTIADFCTQKDATTGDIFEITYNGSQSDTEVEILRTCMRQWSKINEFGRRFWRIFRSTLKYGDQFFIRDPETLKWYWVEQCMVEKVLVNEANGKEPEAYLIRNLNLNSTNLTATQSQTYGNNMQGAGTNTMNQFGGGGAWGGAGARFGPVTNSGGRYGSDNNQLLTAVDASHVIHLSLSEGLDANWPFAISILESVFKTFRQKELLEDAVIIYRIIRAPERRIFYIDTGQMPPHKAGAYIEKVKNEIYQKRIPSRSGGQGSFTGTDSAYSPMSMIDDFFFSTCCSLATNIPLLDGRTLNLQEIIDEYNSGKTNYVYSQNETTHELEAGKIIWASKTRLNTQVIEVTLDNDKTLTVTPDHKFILRDGAQIEAQYLQPGASLMPLYLKTGKTGPDQYKSNYMRYHSNAGGGLKFVHATISNKPRGRDTQVHHWNFNSFDNTPENLVVMTTKDHIDFHKNKVTYHLQTAWKDPIKREKLIAGIKNLYANATPEFLKKISDRNRKNNLNKPPRSQEVKDRVSKTLKADWNKRKIVFSDAMFERMEQLFDAGNHSIPLLRVALPADTTYCERFKEANPIVRRANIHPEIVGSEGVLNNLVKTSGFTSFGAWKQSKLGLKSRYANKYHNHKVVSIRWLADKIDTGDITIETPSGSHIFATDAGVYIHNSSDGRGSKVETLPGGESLGEITDMKYFQNKLLRGLRVPASYFPCGTDDTQATFNDGRMGAAYIQEFRFSQYCQRLQSLLSDTFDAEFKLFVKQRGFNIDSSIFDVVFTTPQHFADFARVEKDSAMINVFTPLVENKIFSKRFLMKRYLGMTEEEITENEEMWRQENPDAMEAVEGEGGGGGGAAGGSMGAEGAPGIDSMGMDDPGADETDPAAGGDTGADPMAGGSPSPGAPPAGAGQAPTAAPLGGAPQ